MAIASVHVGKRWFALSARYRRFEDITAKFIAILTTRSEGGTQSREKEKRYETDYCCGDCISERNTRFGR